MGRLSPPPEEKGKVKEKKVITETEPAEEVGDGAERMIRIARAAGAALMEETDGKIGSAIIKEEKEEKTNRSQHI